VSRFLVIGDLALDVTVAPARPMLAGGDVPATIRLGPGGQAANVAVRLARRGEQVTLAAAVGDDAAGELLSRAMAADGIDLLALPASRSATVVAMLDAGGERSMLSDRQTLRPEPLAAALNGAGWVHCSGYALLDDDVGDRLAALLGGRSAGVPLSLAGGSVPREPARVGRFLERAATARPELVVISRGEAANLSGPTIGSASSAARDLAGVAEVVIVTDGPRGAAAHIGAAGEDGMAVEVAGSSGKSPVLDTTGAGDAFVAALIAELARGGWAPSLTRLEAAMTVAAAAGAAAARVVGAQARVPAEGTPR
jgi:sugar/nucleoside kinase (ribokinase family)